MTTDERIARLDERTSHLATKGDLYRALLIQTLGLAVAAAAVLRLVT